MEEYPYTYPMGNTRFEFFEDGEKKERHVKFSPNLSLQRYAAVLDYLTKASEKDDIRIVTEYGPNSCRFLYQALQTTSWLEQINLVDVSADIISTGYQNICEPRWNRTQRGRIRKLTATVFQGNIAHLDHRVSNSDAVVGIEVIEHLTKADFDEFSKNVFGYIQPQYVIFTTPNREFNVLFDHPDEFRHDDHKFEFTRVECQNWAQEVVDAYPSYKFKVYGIGAPPENVGDVGFASQMVIFERISKPAAVFLSIESYTLIGEILLNCGDNRTSAEKAMAKLATASCRVICDLMYENAHSVYMRQERCAEGHFMDVVPVKMVVTYLAKEGILSDVDAVLMAVREFSSIKHEVEVTIALGPVFVDRRDCDGSYHDDPGYDQSESSPFFYAMSSQNLSIYGDVWSENVDIRRYVEEFLEAAVNLREFLMVTNRETCSLKHSISFLTPEVVVAHLKAGGVDVDSKKVLAVLQEIKKFPAEETSFGCVILIEKYCGDSPCIADPESLEWHSCVDSSIPDLQNLTCDEASCSIEPVEE